jgi:tRNA modification GTPase
MLPQFSDTIVAIATAPGIGAIGTIRLSGTNALEIANRIFKGKNLTLQATHTIHFGHIIVPDSQKEEIIDEVVVSLFLGNKSYTGEPTVEITGHGAPYILQQILDACIYAGARLAQPGEFTQRAFLNGKLDLAQAEAVADLIAANSKAAQQTALRQLRGGFSKDLNVLRDQLINFAALIELELDFSEEDVAFADRKELNALIQQLKQNIQQLINSFKLGNAIKQGVSVAIIGKPNAGKSTLLNALLNEERAIVSDIAGTTRDTIEEQININGIIFKLIDTAGIRESKGDTIEDIGIERSKANAEKADIIIHLISAVETDTSEIHNSWLNHFDHKVITVINKVDMVTHLHQDEHKLYIAAKSKNGIDTVKQALLEKVNLGKIETENTIVTNARHLDALLKTYDSLLEIEQAMELQISGELLALDIRRCLYFLGTITGQVEIDRDILGTIFGKFCIGK